MKNNELNELQLMIKEIENMNLSSKKDALNIKRAMMDLLKKISIKYQNLSVEQQNHDINNIIPEIVSIFAKIQGIDIVCLMGAEKPSLSIYKNQISDVDHATDKAMATINMFNELNEDSICDNKFFTSHANVILIKK